MVVVDDIPTQSAKIGEDTPSSREVEDLNRGRAFVRNLLEAGGSVLATGVEEGIRASAKVPTPVSQQYKQYNSISQFYLNTHNRRHSWYPPMGGYNTPS